MKIETIAVHAGGEVDPATGSVSPPIYLSTTFEHNNPANYVYVRTGNPTQDRLEQALAALEGGEGSLVYSSGMAAASALLQMQKPGTHVIFPEDTYFYIRSLQTEYLPNWQIQYSVVDMKSPESVMRAMRPETKLVWMETPSNPLLDVLDIAEISKIAKSGGALTVVDNTFATPILQRPFEHGADIVLHSTTKYCGGHSDVQGGALVFRKRDEMFEQYWHSRSVLGSVSSPFNSWLVLRGLRTLPCRVEKQAQNAMALAQAMAEHSSVEEVLYPGLPSHRGYQTCLKQMSAGGAMLSILVRGGREKALSVVGKTRLFCNATSLGGVESFMEHRQTQEGPGSNTPSSLLRISVGLESAEDLIDDLTKALE